MNIPWTLWLLPHWYYSVLSIYSLGTLEFFAFSKWIFLMCDFFYLFFFLPKLFPQILATLEDFVLTDNGLGLYKGQIFDSRDGLSVSSWQMVILDEGWCVGRNILFQSSKKAIIYIIRWVWTTFFQWALEFGIAPIWHI